MQNTEPLRGGLNTNPLLFHRLVEADVAEERLGSYCVVLSWKGTSQQQTEGPWKPLAQDRPFRSVLVDV